MQLHLLNQEPHIWASHEEDEVDLQLGTGDVEKLACSAAQLMDVWAPRGFTCRAAAARQKHLPGFSRQTQCPAKNLSSHESPVSMLHHCCHQLRYIPGRADWEEDDKGDADGNSSCCIVHDIVVFFSFLVSGQSPQTSRDSCKPPSCEIFR